MALPKLPETETLNVTEARRQFNEALDRVRRHEIRVVVEKSGIPIGAMVSMEDLARLRYEDENRSRLFAVMDRISAGFDDLTEEEVEADVEKAIAEVKADRRGRRDASKPKGA